MYVCICHAVTLERLQDLEAEGIDSLEAVERTCGAGGDCGACRRDIARVLTARRGAREQQPKAA